MSVDTRTRPINSAGPDDPASFFEGAWRAAAALHGGRAAEDAARLGLPPITMRVDEAMWTLQPTADGIDVVPGPAGADATVSLDRAAFADLFCERRTAMGLVDRRAGRGRSGLQRRLLRLGPGPALPPRRPIGLRGGGCPAPGPGRIAARPRTAVPPRRGHGRRGTFPRGGRLPSAAGRVHRGGDGCRRRRPARRGRGGPARRRHVVVGLHPQRRVLPLPHPRLRTAVPGAAGPDRRRALRLHRCDPLATGTVPAIRSGSTSPT